MTPPLSLLPFSLFSTHIIHGPHGPPIRMVLPLSHPQELHAALAGALNGALWLADLARSCGGAQEGEQQQKQQGKGQGHGQGSAAAQRQLGLKAWSHTLSALYHTLSVSASASQAGPTTL